MIKHSLVLFLFVPWFVLAQVSPPADSIKQVKFAISTLEEEIFLTPSIHCYTDKESLDFEQIQRQDFRPTSEISSFDLSHRIWFHFLLENNHPKEVIEGYIPFNPTPLKGKKRRLSVYKAVLYTKNQTGWTKSNAGRIANVKNAAYPSHKQYAKLQLPPNSKTEYYLSLQYDWRDFQTLHDFPLRLISKQKLEAQEQTFRRAESNSYYFRFSFLAIAFMITIVNFCQYLMNHDKAYLYYALYALSLFLFYSHLYEEGLAFENRIFYGKYFAHLYDYLDILFFFLVFLAQFSFFRYFLNTKKNHPDYDKKLSFGFKLIWAVLGLDLLVRYFFGANIVFGIVHTCAPLLLVIFVIYMILLLYKIGDSLSKIVVTGSLILIIASTLGNLFTAFGGAFLESLPNILQDPAHYAQIGGLIEFVFFSVGLGYRIGYMRTRNQELEQAQAIENARRRFYTNISHELRTPLTLIKGPLKSMQNKTFKGNFQVYYQMMERNADRLLELTNQLLDLSKLEEGRLPLQVSKGPILAYLKNIAYAFESLAVKKQIDYDIHLPHQVPDFHFDADKLEKILVNLLSNAFKFTPDGGRIVFNTSLGNHTLSFEVQDNGIGIPVDELDSIFEHFHQVKHGKTGQQEGSGVGLALAKELVELHHGNIKVSSQIGKGTSFKVEIPTQDEAYKKDIKIDYSNPSDISISTGIEQVKRPSQPSNTYSLPNSLASILVVEDNIDIRHYLVDQLAEQYNILEAENGKEGLALAKEHIPDLIITDLMMPEMDGFGLSRSLKKEVHTSHIPIIMLTARSMREDKLLGIETGADAYLTKPFDREELLLRIRKLIEQREQLKISFKGNSFVKTDDSMSSVDESFIKEAIELIHKHMEDEGFSVSALGQHLGMSRTQLFRKLKAITGDSPSKFIRTVRLNQAMYLLEIKAGNISEIAFQTGFNSLAYFTKCFKDSFGTNPSEILAR